ncbi:MAG: permease [Pseudorhodoplanes sp.]
MSAPKTVQSAWLAYSWRGVKQIDPALIALIAISGALVAIVPQQAATSAAFMSKAIWNVLPFFVLSIAATAYAKASGTENLIARAFAGRAETTIIFASLMGALSPFCSCGVIPVIVALLATGVSLAPVMAFWLASPLMDPSMFALTTGLLGLEFAVAKTVAAIAIGLLGGFSVLALQGAGFLVGSPLRDGVGNGGCAASKIRNPKAIVWRYWEEPARREAFWQSAWQNTVFLGKWLLLAFLLESLMVAYIPGDIVARIAGDGSPLSIAMATLVGIPSYLNGNAALPLVAGLIGKGMSSGAAMAFLLGGGVTSIPAALAVWAITQKKVFAIYLASAFIGSLAAGLAFQMAAG